MPTLRQTIALYAVLTALVLLLAACTTAGDVAVHSPTPPVPLPAGVDMTPAPRDPAQDGSDSRFLM